MQLLFTFWPKTRTEVGRLYFRRMYFEKRTAPMIIALNLLRKWHENDDNYCTV